MNDGKKVSVTLLVGTMLLALTACAKEGPAEQAGKEVDKTVEQAGKNVDQATDEAAERLKQAGQAIKDAAERDAK